MDDKRSFRGESLLKVVLFIILVLAAISVISSGAKSIGGNPVPAPTQAVVITPTYPPVMCTPPPCRKGEIYYCKGGVCPGDCGTVCVTPTPRVLE